MAFDKLNSISSLFDKFNLSRNTYSIPDVFVCVILCNHLDILQEGMESNSCIVLLLILSQKSVVLIFF